VKVPADTPVKFRLTSADVVHGFLLPDTNVNTMVVPGFVSEVRTTFSTPATTRCRVTSSAASATRACGRMSASSRKTNFPS